mgnify:CR=1 FL=1
MQTDEQTSKYEHRSFQPQPKFRLPSISSPNGNLATNRFEPGETSPSCLKVKMEERLKTLQKEKAKNETIVGSDTRSSLHPEDRLTLKKETLSSQKDEAAVQQFSSPQPKQERVWCFNPPNITVTGTDFSNSLLPKGFSLSSLENKEIENITSVSEEKINPHLLSPPKLNEETTYNKGRKNIEPQSPSPTTGLLPSPQNAKAAKTMSFHSKEKTEQNLLSLGPHEDNGNRRTNENVFHDEAHNIALACKLCPSPQKSLRSFPPKKVPMPYLSSPHPKDNTSWFENQTNKIIVDDDSQASLELIEVSHTSLDTTTATTSRSFSKEKVERRQSSPQPNENTNWFEKQMKKNVVENNKQTFMEPQAAKTTMAVSPSEDTTCYLDRQNKKDVAHESQAFSKPSERFTSPPKCKTANLKRYDVNRPVAVILEGEMCLVEQQQVHFLSKEWIPQTDSDGDPLLCYLKPLPPSFDRQGNFPQKQRAKTHARPRVIINKQRQMVFIKADVPKCVNRPPNLDLNVQNINSLKPPQKFQRLQTPSPPPSPGRLLDRRQTENKVFFGASVASRCNEDANCFSRQVRSEENTRSCTAFDETGANREKRMARRVGVREQDNAIRERTRRVAVCTTTDTTARERQFVRVIGKRF